MSQLFTAAVFHQQMPANEIRKTRARLEAIVSRYRAARSKFRPCKEIADLFKRSTVLQRETHQAGNDVVETDQFGRTVRAFQAKKDFGGLFVVMHAEVEGALTGDFDFLGNVMAAGGESTTRSRSVVYIVHAVCKSL